MPYVLKKQLQLVDGPVQYMIGMTLTGGLTLLVVRKWPETHSIG